MNEFPSQTVQSLRKAGQLDEAWSFGFDELNRAPNDSYLKSALFWVCYDFLKNHQEQIAKRGQTSGNFRPNDSEFDSINRLLQTIFQLKEPSSGLEYRMIFVLFKKNLEYFPSLVHCVLNYQASLFDQEAKEPYQAEKGEIPSLMLTVARQVVKAWLSHAKLWQLDVDKVMDFVNVTRQHVKDTKHLIWLDYDQSKCLISEKRFADARKLIIPILKKKQSEPWAWGVLAATYREEDPKVAISLYAKGIGCARDVTFSVRLLYHIIPLLLGAQQALTASMCLKKLISAYNSHGWKLKAEMSQMTQQSWYDSNVDETELKSSITSLSKDALNYLYDDLKKIPAIVESVHKSGKGFQVFENKETKIPVRLGVHESKKMPKVGDFVELTVSDSGDESNVISSKLIDKVDIPDVSYIEGEIKITAKGFGFVENTFVPPYLAKDFENGSDVSVIRVMAWDRSKSRFNWKAIKIQAM